MRILLPLFILLLCFSFLIAQESRDTTFLIDSEAFGVERKIHVHLPKRYLSRTQDTFMVVYALDAHADFYWDMAKSNVAYLVDNFQILPMIVVGIHQEDRGTEFIPAARDTTLEYNTNGVAHLLQQHLREEVFPIIQKRYRVNDKRAVVGHSRGGAFISHTLFSDQRDLFDAYIGISPAMHYMENQILNDAAKVLARKPGFNKFLFCTYGTVGSYEESFSEQVVFLDSLIQERPNTSLFWDSAKIEGTTHWTVVIPSWNLGLMKLTQAYSVDQYLLEQFAANTGQRLRPQAEAHLAAQEARLGWTRPITAGNLNYYANEFEELAMPTRAQECYEWALRIDPDNYRISRNLASLHQDQGRPVEALRYFQQSLISATANQDSLSEKRFANTKKYLEEKITELKEELGQE